jgi:hypothetical protein
VHSLEVYYTDAVERARQAVEGIVHQVVTELESGGNIRFESGKPTDPWCADDAYYFSNWVLKLESGYGNLIAYGFC